MERDRESLLAKLIEPFSFENNPVSRLKHSVLSRKKTALHYEKHIFHVTKAIRISDLVITCI